MGLDNSQNVQHIRDLIIVDYSCIWCSLRRGVVFCNYIFLHNRWWMRNWALAFFDFQWIYINISLKWSLHSLLVAYVECGQFGCRNISVLPSSAHAHSTCQSRAQCTSHMLYYKYILKLWRCSWEEEISLFPRSGVSFSSDFDIKYLCLSQGCAWKPSSIWPHRGYAVRCSLHCHHFLLGLNAARASILVQAIAPCKIYFSCVAPIN